MLDDMISKLKEEGDISEKSEVLFEMATFQKLAIAFGLISTKPGTPIQIVKNLRVCTDCHTATKIISKVYKRVVVEIEIGFTILRMGDVLVEISGDHSYISTEVQDCCAV